MIKLKEGQKVIAENGDVYEIENGDILTSKVIKENKADISEIVANVDFTELNKQVEKITGLKGVKFEVSSISKNKYVNVIDTKNYAKEAGCLSSIYDTLTLQTFNTEVSLDKDMWFMTINWHYEYLNGGSNGTTLLTAWYKISTKEWVFR